MAKIRDAKPKSTAGGYERLVGNSKMAQIFTMAQSTVISNGTQLEKLICKSAVLIDDLNSFMDECFNKTAADGTYLCPKQKINNSRYALKGHEPDFLIFKVDVKHDTCYVVELKDGDTFDTKKSAAEKEMLQLFTNHIATKIPFATKFFICCFNQLEKEKIVAGLKSTFTKDEVITGKEFCNMLGISYDTIVKSRQEDAADNFQFVIEQLSEIKEVRSSFIQKSREHIIENEFYDDEIDMQQADCSE